ncbi:MAG: hypothetical protein ACRD1T_13105 [Acidimicrobiia bacterium]
MRSKRGTGTQGATGREPGKVFETLLIGWPRLRGRARRARPQAAGGEAALDHGEEIPHDFISQGRYWSRG